MKGYEIDIDKKKLEVMKFRCIQDEKKNDKTKLKKDNEMVEVIRKIIMEEASKNI